MAHISAPLALCIIFTLALNFSHAFRITLTMYHKMTGVVRGQRERGVELGGKDAV